MKKKTFISKLGIMFTLIFSFLTCILPTADVVNAAYSSETVYKKVEVNNVSVSGNTIRVKLKEELNVLAFTYEYAYLDVEGVKVSQLATCDKIKKISDHDYEFSNTNGKELLGVKIWKIQYKETETYRPDYMSSGNNEWKKTGTTGIDGSQRLKTLQVTKNKLTYNMMEFDDYDIGDLLTGYKKEYTGVLFFSFDNEEQNIIIDSIYRINVRLVTYENTWTFWGASQEFGVNRTTHDVEIYEEQTTETKRVNGVVVEDTPMIGKGLNDEGYDWYILFNNRLKDKDGNLINLSAESGFLGYSGSQTYLDEVAILNLTYVYDGVFYESEVLDFGTGITVYYHVEDEGFWGNLMKWFDGNVNWIVVAVVGLVVVIIVGFFNKILHLLRLDKDSREKRKMKREIRELRELEMQGLRNELSSRKNGKNSKYSNVKRYKK